MQYLRVAPTTMLQQTRKIQIFIICLSFLAGFVDALGYMSMGGMFVSFMSGNTTRLGVELSHPFTAATLLPGVIILCFVAGVFTGSSVGRRYHQVRQPVLLGIMTLILVTVASLATHMAPVWLLLLLTFTMGMENTLFQSSEISIGLTYMTGTLVRMAQHFSEAVFSRWNWDWARYALLWMGLMAGALSGTWCYRWLHFSAVWVPAAIAMGLWVTSVAYLRKTT